MKSPKISILGAYFHCVHLPVDCVGAVINRPPIAPYVGAIINRPPNPQLITYDNCDFAKQNHRAVNNRPYETDIPGFA